MGKCWFFITGLGWIIKKNILWHYIFQLILINAPEEIQHTVNYQEVLCLILYYYEIHSTETLTGCIKQKSAFKHTQNVQIQIILHMRKV